MKKNRMQYWCEMNMKVTENAVTFFVRGEKGLKML